MYNKKAPFYHETGPYHETRPYHGRTRPHHEKAPPYETQAPKIVMAFHNKDIHVLYLHVGNHGRSALFL